MGRRRFLGSIDAFIGARIELDKRFDANTIAKIDTLGTFSSNTLTGIGNLDFEGDAMKPTSIEIVGEGNHIKLAEGNFLKLHGTDHDGNKRTFKITIQGSILQLIPE